LQAAPLQLFSSDFTGFDGVVVTKW